MKRKILGTLICYTTASERGDGELIDATKEAIREAAELGAMCLRYDRRVTVEVLLSDGSRKRVVVDMTEVGA